MQDKNVANSTPEGNELGVADKTRLAEADGMTDSLPRQRKKSAYRILVVEDDTSLARVEANVLTAHNYSVVLASNAEQAIATLNQFVPDLVILDLELPGSLSGWNVLQALRENSRAPVLLTTSLEPNIRQYFRIYGENRSTLDHLPKPFPMQTLLKRIQRMLLPALSEAMEPGNQ
jgi:DNA-binding response OmpR family regulator